MNKVTVGSRFQLKVKLKNMAEENLGKEIHCNFRFPLSKASKLWDTRPAEINATILWKLLLEPYSSDHACLGMFEINQKMFRFKSFWIIILGDSWKYFEFWPLTFGCFYQCSYKNFLLYLQWPTENKYLLNVCWTWS